MPDALPDRGGFELPGLFQPLPIAYRGLYADDHFVDAYQFGRSLAAVSKAANIACHFWLFGQITSNHRAHRVKFFAGPSRENGLLQEIVAMVMAGHLPTYSPIFLKMAPIIIEKILEYVAKYMMHRQSDANNAMEKIHDLATRNAEFARQVHKGHMRDKAWLQDQLGRMVDQMRPSFREVPEPVGKSVREIEIGSGGNGFTIDEPSAEAMRSKGVIEVGDAGKYTVAVEGVFKTDGACRLRLPDGQIVSGKITDPALAQPGNVYTTALDRGAMLNVTAKPTLKNGKISRLYVSDARQARTTRPRGVTPARRQRASITE